MAAFATNVGASAFPNAKSGKHEASAHIWTDGNETVLKLKQAVFDATGIPVSEQRISIGGVWLKNSDRLQDFGIDKNSIIDVQRADSDKMESPPLSPSSLKKPSLKNNASKGTDTDSPDTNSKGKESQNPEEMVKNFFVEDYDSLDSLESSGSKDFGTEDAVCQPCAPCTTSTEETSSSAFTTPSPLPTVQPIPEWLTKLLISSLPTWTLKGDGSDLAHRGACAVCQYDYKAADTVVQTPCRHVFHQSCLQPWLSVGRVTCPQCRFKLSDIDFGHGVSGKRKSSKKKAVLLNVDGYDTGRSIKLKIEDFCGVPANMQRLTHKGLKLQDDVPLKSQKLKEGNELQMFIRLDSADQTISDNGEDMKVPSKALATSATDFTSKLDANVKSKSELHFKAKECETLKKSRRKAEKKLRVPLMPIGTRTSLRVLPKLPAERCAVCQFDYKTGDNVVETACQHRFHKGCIEPWLLMSPTCPACRFGLCSSGKLGNGIHKLLSAKRVVSEERDHTYLAPPAKRFRI